MCIQSFKEQIQEEDNRGHTIDNKKNKKNVGGKPEASRW
jgi:histone acetyltransferase (RNA polymerase elongator complex component)